MYPDVASVGPGHSNCCVWNLIRRFGLSVCCVCTVQLCPFVGKVDRGIDVGLVSHDQLYCVFPHSVKKGIGHTYICLVIPGYYGRKVHFWMCTLLYTCCLIYRFT